MYASRVESENPAGRSVRPWNPPRSAMTLIARPACRPPASVCALALMSDSRAASVTAS
jgi:hypothetical protein